MPKIIDKEITTFRGQVNKHWELIPSGFRENSKKLRLYSDKDLILFLKEFKSEIKANITNDISNYTDGEWEIYAQHYGLPTRLLDVSFSPLTALLFAVEDAFDSSSVDAVVWGFNTNAINVSQFGSEEILNLSTDHYNFDLLKKPCFIKSATLNKRLLAQKGAFICFDKNYRNQIDILKENAIKIIIPKEYKKDILNSLFHFGINFYGLYPDIDSISKDIKMKKALESECEEHDE